MTESRGDNQGDEKKGKRIREGQARERKREGEPGCALWCPRKQNKMWWEQGATDGPPMKRGTSCPCGWQHSAASPRDSQALQLREHVFWTFTGASAIRRAIQNNLPGFVQLLPRHVWLLEQPCQTMRKEVWYVVCLAALTAMLRARGMMFSTLARTGLEPAVVGTRAVDLLLAALTDFAACQGSVSSFSDLGQAHPFVYVC